MRLLAVVTEQRAAASLGKIILRPRQAIVEPQHGAAPQRLRHVVAPRGEALTVFGCVALLPAAARRPQRCTGLRQRLICRALRPSELRTLQDDAELAGAGSAPAETPHRQRIQHLVRKHNAVERRRGRGVEPRDMLDELRHFTRQAMPLPLPQVGAGLEDPVVRRQAVQRPESRQHVGSEASGARADFQDAAAREPAEDRRTLPRDAGTEQRRDLGRRDEVSRCAELVRARTVVTEARRIQREFHVALEAEPPARGPDGLINGRAHRGRVPGLSSDLRRFTLETSSGIVGWHDYP